MHTNAPFQPIECLDKLINIKMKYANDLLPKERDAVTLEIQT